MQQKIDFRKLVIPFIIMLAFWALALWGFLA